MNRDRTTAILLTAAWIAGAVLLCGGVCAGLHFLFMVGLGRALRG